MSVVKEHDKNPLLEAQKVMVDMMIAVHNICEKYGIQYWLTDGSLLGCIRHQGFIPWDDDADMAMLREDYEKFIDIVEAELPSPYKLESIEHNTHGLHNWCKIMYMDDFEWIDWHGNWTKGLSIDIFPFDFVPNPNRKTFVEKVVNRIAKIEYPLQGNSIKNVTKQMINRMKIHKIYNKFNQKTNYVTYGIETKYYGWAYYHIDDIFPLKKGLFANHYFYIPNNSDSYLTVLYGADYRKLPKEADRVSHMKNLRFANSGTNKTY
jgi:lipopolysaccharide cholinephosphotransferase